MSDAQDRAEAQDSDKLGTPDDPEIEPEYPFDQLMGADEYGITAAEERVDEPLEERVEREIPDPLAEALDAEVEDQDRNRNDTSLEAELDKIEQQLDEEAIDLAAVEGAEIARAGGGLDVPDRGQEVGRIVEDGTDDDVTEFIDFEGDAVGSAAPADDLSAEEAAVHLTEDPPMGRLGGGYVD